MPKKNSIINNNPEQEKILIEDEIPQEEEFIKPKRQISDAQREHLNNIRSKALEKKAQMKEETLKAKLAKTYEKKELVKKYDDYIEKEKEKEKEKELPQLAEKKGDIKPKKEKTIVYKLAETSSSDSSSDDEEEEKVVYVKKYKNKNKQKVYSEPKRETLDSTLYKSSQEMLHSRAIEERVRSNLVKWNNAMMPQEY
jgi:hypothetical protein